MAAVTTTSADYVYGDVYDEGLHPPAIVHIPEEYKNDDPNSVGNIESPLSSPRNSPNASDVEDEEEDDDPDSHAEQMDSFGLPLNNSIAGVNANQGGQGQQPFDEGNQYYAANDSKITALNSIRDERMQRKMRRRQHLLSEEHRIHRQNEQRKIDEEEQPFDLQQVVSPQIIINVEELDNAEEQPFDAPPERSSGPRTGPEHVNYHFSRHERQVTLDTPFGASASFSVSNNSDASEQANNHFHQQKQQPFPLPESLQTSTTSNVSNIRGAPEPVANHVQQQKQPLRMDQTLEPSSSVNASNRTTATSPGPDRKSVV